MKKQKLILISFFFFLFNFNPILSSEQNYLLISGKPKITDGDTIKINNKKMYCYEGSILVAGSAIQWLRDKLKFFKNI